MGLIAKYRARYRLRTKRKRHLWQALRSRWNLQSFVDQTDRIDPDSILVFSVMRNEALRLPFFLAHYRALGVQHFLIVDNGSDDGTVALLAAQPDVSLWQTDASYREARFGVDWSTWLQIKYGHDHWCLTVDADEILIYPHWQTHDLRAVTTWLDSQSIRAFGAHMLDMYPKGPISQAQYAAGDDPFNRLGWFDAGPYRKFRQDPLQNLWVQGGARERMFFASDPDRSPTLNKLPLVRWNRRYTYVNSTHSILPPALNLAYDGPGGTLPSGVLLHSKFLDVLIEKSREEKQRQQHHGQPDAFQTYHEILASDPDLWCESSVAYEGWQQLESLSLMANGGWQKD